MKAIILNNKNVINFDGREISPCFLDFNNTSIVEKMIKQLKKLGISGILAVLDDEKNPEEFKKIGIDHIFANSINKLCDDLKDEEEILLINGNVVVDDIALQEIINSNFKQVIAVNNYEYWKSGIKLDKNNITAGIYKTTHKHLSELIYINLNKKESKKEFIDLYHKEYIKGKCCEINNLADYYNAKLEFSKSEEEIKDTLLGCWGGYWRYPEYLDYFYLVTPYYPPQEMIAELKDNFEPLLTQYPSGMKINSMLAAKEFNINQENIVIGNGAAELIKFLMEQITGLTGIIKPSFDEYYNRLPKENCVVFEVKSNDFSYSSSDLIEFYDDKNINNLVIVNPDNPSGNYIKKKNMIELLEWAKTKGIKVIIDESFVDFVDEENPTLIKQSIIDEYKNLYIIKSISKSYGVPGLRLGVLASGDKNIIELSKKKVSIWNINSFAEFYMQIAHKYKEQYIESLKRIRDERSDFQKRLNQLDYLEVIPSQANYLMVKLDNKINPEELQKRMLIDKKVFIKTLTKKIAREEKFLRIAIRNHEDNVKFARLLDEVITGMRED